MNEKHTPGPWSLHEHMGGIWTTECEEFTAHSAAFGAVEILIGEIFGTRYKPGYEANGHRRVSDFEEIEANARLISAAPELLTCLQQLLDGMVGVEDSDDGVLLRAREAILKATGAAA